MTATSSVGISSTSQFSNAVTVPGATASFVGSDTTTQGSWRNAYGADGYDIAADTSGTDPVLPSYATLSTSGTTPFVWAASTTDPRALENVANTGRTATTWYTSTSMNFDVNITDGKTHEVSLYAVDFVNKNRSEQVQVIDAGSGAVLSTETLSSFQGGAYLTWNISGNVVIKVTNLNASTNAVVSGLFFGGKPAGATASFVGSDTTTQGSWRNAYGADGYDIAADTSGTDPVVPSYATLSTSGTTPFVWASSTTDARALQNAADTGRIASCWYTSTSMNFDVNITDGKTHEVSLYAVNFVNKSRSEQVQVIDAGSGAVLSTETLSSFQGGAYLTWNISGNVVIKVTNLNASANAVVSGLFFGGKPAGATASFVGSDTTTQGSWRGAYGANGYDIAADTSGTDPVVPSYATLSTSGTTPFVWAASTTDPRALENVANTGRTATTWYTSTSMSFDLDITDGQSHEVSLYAVDFVNKSRSEQVQVLDATTGTVLDTETLNSFQGGEYLTWNISGNVVIKVTNLNPSSNAVVSGLFFD